ncbi:MAG: histidine phosphatase family protein, partial [Vicinamibacterales bacterium]
MRVAPEVPVPHWGLADKGRARADLAARAAWMQHVGVIVTSGETKALETAAIIAAICDVPIVVRAAMGENDRSATGYLPPDAFEAMVDAFFAEPHASVRGWESAADAQARIVADVDAVL